MTAVSVSTKSAAAIVAMGVLWPACATGGGTGGFGPDDNGGTASGPGASDDAGSIISDASTYKGDPRTCEEAQSSHSYVGCDYWPTVVANYVWSLFDFAVVVANAGTDPANVTVTGANGVHEKATVPPGQLATIYLPWVQDLKGMDWDPCTLFAGGLPSSVWAPKGAYHLVSDKPVSVYQFNALEYAPQGGPPGKNWSACVGSQQCAKQMGIGCFSYTNDASLLLPTTALTGNYRITGHQGAPQMGMYFAITATQDGTEVDVKVGNYGIIVQLGDGTIIPETNQGQTLKLHMNAGDVAELTAPGSKADLSGSLVHASAPVQVITGLPCMVIPDGAPACDHMEESNFPAETFGQDYVVTRPPGPNGDVVSHLVRFFGNFDDTHLTYDPAAPPGCPTTLQAGQVVECFANYTSIVDQDFEVKADKPFAVATFTQGASVVDPNTPQPYQKGDPAQSLPTAVEQYRTKYVFLAPSDYDISYVEVIAPKGADATLDGKAVTGFAPVGGGAFTVTRVKLDATAGGAHTLTSAVPVGIQVIGYGSYTSYMYPGGLNLGKIAPPPVF